MIEAAASYCVISSPIQLPSWAPAFAVVFLALGVWMVIKRIRP